MTTTPDPEPAEPIAAMEIRRTVNALVVDSVSAHCATWATDGRPSEPDDVRIVVEVVDQLGRQHHLSLSPDSAGALLSTLNAAHLEALYLREGLK